MDMLTPQFSLRRMLGLVTLAGFVCLVLAAAVRGKLWSIGVLVALAGLVVSMAMYFALFVVLWCCAWLKHHRGPARGKSSAG